MPKSTQRLSALVRATTVVAEGLAEDRLLPLLARCAADAVDADLAAVYLHPQATGTAAKPTWRLAAHWGGEAEVLRSLPSVYGEGGGVLASLFQSVHEILEPDLLDGDDEDAPIPPLLPARALIGVPIRRRDSRPLGVMVV